MSTQIDSLKGDLTKSLSARERLESLCRELQRHTKLVSVRLLRTWACATGFYRISHQTYKSTNGAGAISRRFPQSETKKVAEAEQEERERLMASVEETVKELEAKRLAAETETRGRMEEHEK